MPRLNGRRRARPIPCSKCETPIRRAAAIAADGARLCYPCDAKRKDPPNAASRESRTAAL